MENKQKFQGNWKCSGCGRDITELPFEPRGEANNLTCKDCYLKRKDSQGSPKQKFQGNWKCSKCGGDITELPFEPKSTANLTCKDCYMKNK